MPEKLPLNYKINCFCVVYFNNKVNMGAYLSEPVTEKNSTDEENDRLRYGVSSMQGWRISQEDAHNCVMDFDKNASLFAVYDGHGGHEVAAYCAQKLPEFLKATEAYKQADFEKALVDAFLGFDATIGSREVVAVLKEIAGVKDNDDEAQDGSDYDEENVSNLYEEASMPIEQVMEKYQFNLLNPHLKKMQGDKLPVSPLLKARKSSEGESSGCSSSSGVRSQGESSKSSVSSTTSSTNNGETSSSNSGSEIKDKEEKCEIMSKSETEKKSIKQDITEDKKEVKTEGLKVDKKDVINEDKKEDTKPVINEDIKEDLKGVIKEDPKEDEIITNGETETPQVNGEGSSKKGKGKAVLKKSSNPESSTASATSSSTTKTMMNLRKRFVGKLYTKLLENQQEESDSDDDNDITFEGVPSYSSSDDSDKSSEGADDENEDSPDDDDDDAEENDEDEDLYDEEDETNEFTRNMTEEPGSDSGCTAVLALLRENTVYVANAGDSRCIICRKGEALDMSFDHKPEDDPERERIVKAGGKVTPDGRVNGGLNLSRAIGDHAYKQNKELSDREQMITALPDIKTCTINPVEDEFMVLACDGIWNFMSSQEVVDFVKPRLNRETGPEKLSQICEELFDHCLAPHTMGDGTGCDNMTAIIVQFKNGLMKRSSDDSDEMSAKRTKTEDETISK